MNPLTSACSPTSSRLRRSLAADALSREPQKPNFEFVAGKRIFEDKAHRIEIIDIGPNPHAEELFVANQY